MPRLTENGIQALRAALANKKMTQAQLAREMPLRSTTMLSQFCAGKGSLTDENVSLIEAVIGGKLELVVPNLHKDTVHKAVDKVRSLTPLLHYIKEHGADRAREDMGLAIAVFQSTEE